MLDYTYAEGLNARLIAGPIRVAGVSLPTHAAPPMGADTVALLRAAGYSDARIAALRAAGAIATADGADAVESAPASEALALAAAG